MLGRLLVGILKGLVIGGLVGFGLAKAGLVAPGALVAYLAAAVTGVLVGLVAGKPIWAKDAKLEAGMKAFFGALLASGMLFAVRRWLGFPVPLDVPGLTQAGGTLGSLAITSFPIVAALLAGFYDADNDAPAEDASTGKRVAPASQQRVATPADDEAEDEAAQASKKTPTAKR